MSFVKSFAPLAAPDATLLILGSMPGEASLKAGEYYAHSRNAFWPIMGQLFGFDPSVAYDERVRCLLAAGVAVWDVLASCHRVGSLDSEIDDTSVAVNDFGDFFRQHPQIQRVFFNGTKAEHSFRKWVIPTLPGLDLVLFRLPSTSPANASFSLEKKCQAWKAIFPN